MHRRSDEELFVAYRRHRDTDALGVLFRRRVEELLRLAVFLAERPSDAEDLVQATFLSAISRAETFHEGSRVMSWLCGILTNHARMLRRAERRRLADLGAADSDPAPQPIHAALRAEVRQALDQGIGNLPEPYRSVLTLYLREGLDSREISRRLARPRATVRKQMERALDRLRTALPIGLATALVARMNPAQLALRAADAARFVEPCEPLADGPPADDGAVGAPRSSALPIALAGLLVLALVAATFPFHGSTAAAPVPADEVASAPGQGVAITVGTALAPVGVAADPTRAAADPAAELLVEAVGCDGAPRPGIVVLLARDDGRALPERLTARTAPTATTDAGGHARFAGLRPGAYEVALPGSLPQLRVELAAGRTTARLLLPEPVPFGGRVVDDAGLPVADAEILVSETSGRGDLGAVVARTDAGGWFHAEALVERARVFARHPDHGPSNSVRLQPDGDCELALEPAGRRVEVRVFDGDGGPVADAYVALAPRSHGTDMVLPQHGRTDRSGAIVFTDPGEREATVVASRSDLPPAIAELPTDTDALTLVLGAGGTVRGIAVDERGEPLADQPVAATLTHARSNEPAGPLLARTVRTRADGTFEFARLPVGPLKVWIGGHDPADSLHGFLNRYVVAGADVDVEPGATHELRLVARAPTALHGRLRDGDGHDLAGFWIVAVPTRGVAFHRLGRARSARTAADGSFALAGVDPTTTYCLGAFPPAAQIDQLDSFPTAIRYAAAGDAPTEFTLRTAWQPCGRLRCRVVAPPGQAVAGTVLELRHREFCFPTTRAVSVDGSCEFGPLPPGDYYLAVATSESGTLTLPVVMPDDGSDVDLDAVQLALPARVVVDLHRQGGGSVADLRVVGRLAIGDKYVTATTDASGRAVLPALPPGEAIVLVHGPGMQPIERRLTLTDGPQWLELEAEPAAAVALTFRYAPVDNPFLINGPLLVDVVRPGGDIVFSDNVGAATSPGVFELTTGLPAGDYTVRATSLWNASAAIELHVERDRPVAAEATLRL